MPLLLLPKTGPLVLLNQNNGKVKIGSEYGTIY